MDKRNLTLLCDFYEITMANGYFLCGKKDTVAYFDVFFRDIPDGGGHIVSHCGKRAGGGGDTADISSPRAQKRGIRALRAACAELADRPARGGADNAVCLRGDKRLVIYRREHICFDKLRLYHRGANGEYRFAREDRRSLRHGVNIAGEAEGGKVF